jgi:UDP-N-acetylglucosamine:LPS N-acetylglucosamine transferase
MHHVVGFRPEVKRWMSLADYFIGKPGPGSLSEAVHMRLPVVTIRNAWTMPQERYNTD